MSKKIKIIFFIHICCLTIWSESIMTIIDDDAANLQAIESIKQIADRQNIKVTFGVIARSLEDNPDKTTRLLEYQKEGHEIASHSYSHLPSIWSRRKNNDNFLLEMEDDLIKADNVLKNAGFHPTAFIYPYGKFSGSEYRSSIIDMVQKHYPVAFNSRGGFNHSSDTCFGYVGRFPMRSHNHLSILKLKIAISLRKGDSWIVILTHSGMSNFSKGDLEEIIEFSKKKGIIFMTATEAFHYWQKRDWKSIPNNGLQDFTLFDEAMDFFILHCFFVLFTILILAISCCIAYHFIKKHLKTKVSSGKTTVKD